MRRSPFAFAAPLALLLALAGPARADDDFDPEGHEWNGLSELVQIAKRLGVHVTTPARLDVGTLDERDAVLLVYPTREPTVEGLTGFMRAGGRVALADDFGEGRGLLAAYHIDRIAPSAPGAMRLRGNDNLLVARPLGGHPLVSGVPALVTNHPMVVAHSGLPAVFALAGDRDAVVLAGAVGDGGQAGAGDGRLIAIGDPSALINNMLQFRGNRRFAENLVRYLAVGRSGKLVLVTRDAAVVGVFGDPGADRPTHDLRQALAALAQAELPRPALKLLALVIAAILLLAAATALPRSSPYGVRALYSREAASGGFFGRVRFYRERPNDLLQPLLAYKFELEGEIVHRMNLTGRTLLRDLVDGLRTRGVPEADVVALRALLVELDDLRARQDHPPGPPRVTTTKLHDAIAVGERVLARLGPGRESRA